MLKFSVLASGSTGNAIYIESEHTRVLLDAGVSGRRISERLAATAGRTLADLDALLVTHEHIDHVRGLRQVSRHTHAPLYATEGTWSRVMPNLADVEAVAQRWQTVTAGRRLIIGDIAVTPFAVSHDATEPVAYRFDCGGSALAVATDLGYVSDAVRDALCGCQCVVLETNHDPGMLRAGSYPWNVKRRILGDKGHLSNEDAAYALADVLASEPVSVYLAHLSQENNQPDLAELTVGSILRELRQSLFDQVTLYHTHHTIATPLTTV